MTLLVGVLVALLLSVWLLGPLIARITSSRSEPHTWSRLALRLGGLVAAAAFFIARGPGETGSTESLPPLMVVDVSASMSPGGQASDAWFQDWLALTLPSKDTGWIAFGHTARFVRGARTLSEVRSLVGEGGTRLSKALALAEKVLRASGSPSTPIRFYTDLSPEGGGPPTPDHLDEEDSAGLRRAAAAGSSLEWIPFQAPAEVTTRACEAGEVSPVQRIHLPRRSGAHEDWTLELHLALPCTRPVNLQIEVGDQVARMTSAQGTDRITHVFRAPAGPGLFPVTIRAEVGSRTWVFHRFLTLDPAPRIDHFGSSRGPLGALLATSDPRKGIASATFTHHKRWPDERTLSGSALIILEDLSPEELRVLNPDALNQIGRFIRRGTGLLITGGESVFGDRGYDTSTLGPLLPISNPAHGAAGDALSLLVVLDTSASFAEAVSQKPGVLRRLLEGLFSQVGPDGEVAVVGFADQEISPAALGCADLLADRPEDRLLPWQSRGEAILASQVEAAYRRHVRSQGASPGASGSRISQEGIHLKSALDFAFEEMACRDKAMPGYVVVIAEETDISAIGPQHWTPDSPPSAVLLESMQRYRKVSPVHLSVIGIGPSSPGKDAPRRPLQIAWSVLESHLDSVGWTSHRLDQGAVPVFGEERRFWPVYQSGPALLRVNARLPLSRILTRGLAVAPPDAYMEIAAPELPSHGRLLSREGADVLIQVRGQQDPAAGWHPLVALWFPPEGTGVLPGPLAVVTSPLPFLQEPQAHPWPSFFHTLSNFLVDRSSPLPSLRVTGSATVPQLVAEFPTRMAPESLSITSAGASKRSLWSDGNGRFTVDFPEGTTDLELKASWAGPLEGGWAGDRWAIQTQEALSATEYNETFTSTGTSPATSAALLPDGLPETSDRPAAPPLAMLWLALWMAAVVGDASLRSQT